MKRHQQLALPLGHVEIPENLLRTAWERSQLKIDFEEAMQLYHFRTALKHVAIAIAKRGRKAK